MKALEIWLCAVIIAISLFIVTETNAQDPYVQHFNTNSSYHNPALVGQKGALSLAALHRSQYVSFAPAQFSTSFLSIEESVPCLPFDWGLYMMYDQEGSALLKTFEGGVNVAGTYGVALGQSIHNIKVGLSPRWFYKRIDYSKLVFSDQLDPKYGILNSLGQPNNSSFVTPQNNNSLVSFSPAVGLSLKSVWNTESVNPVSSNFGFAIVHALSIGGGNGNIESLLRNENGSGIPVKTNAFLELEFIPYNDKAIYISVTPIIFYEQQGDLSYTEMGSRVGLNSNLSIGFYYHSSSSSIDASSTNWFSISMDTGWLLSKNQRVDLGISYSNNVSGLRNYVGPTLEVGIRYHLAKSPTCSINNKDDLIPYGNGVKCPTKAFTPGRRKIYENIWYKTIFKKYQ